MRRIISYLLLALSLVLAGTCVYAEDIANYSDCDVCPGTIHYGPDDARRLLGQQGFDLITQLKQFDRITINLDEVLPSSPPKGPAKPCAVKLHGNALVIYLQDAIDESYVQIVTDYPRAQQTGSLVEWLPEIYMQSAKANSIELTDSLDLAWDKMRESNIYRWVMAVNEDARWTEAMMNRLVQVLKILNN